MLCKTKECAVCPVTDFGDFGLEGRSLVPTAEWPACSLLCLCFVLYGIHVCEAPKSLFVGEAGRLGAPGRGETLPPYQPPPPPPKHPKPQRVEGATETEMREKNAELRGI